MKQQNASIWVFADYRNYFQNRVTLQLLAKANDLASELGADVCAVVFGYETDEYVAEYIAHGAHKVMVIEHPSLKQYSVEKYTALMEKIAREYEPEIILIGATSFGKEFAPRVAKCLDTGLTADCIGLEITADGNLLQIAPSFGGNLIAEIITPDHRPQMATVRPGTFQEIPHNADRRGEVLRLKIPEKMPADRLRLVAYERQPERDQRLEDAKIVVCGGRGMGSRAKFKKLFELASCWRVKWVPPGPLSTPVGPMTRHLSARPASTSNPRSFFPLVSAAPFSTPPPLPTPILSSPSTKTPMPP